MRKRHRKKAEKKFLQRIKSILEKSIFKATIQRRNGKYSLLVEDGQASESFSVEELASMLPATELLFRVDLTLILKQMLGGAEGEEEN